MPGAALCFSPEANQELRNRVIFSTTLTHFCILHKLNLLTLIGHASLNDIQGWLIFTEVIWHVAICIYCQQVCSTARGKLSYTRKDLRYPRADSAKHWDECLGKTNWGLIVAQMPPR